MKTEALKLSGAYKIFQERRADDRGFFTRVYCEEELRQLLERPIRQSNMSMSRRAGTTRGLHAQVGKYAEDKLLYCSAGELINVIVDIRPESPTFLQHEIVNLSAENGIMTLVPRGFANGIQTLRDNTVLNYLVTNFYNADAEIGFSIFDPSLNIELPMKPSEISEKDLGWAHLTNGAILAKTKQLKFQ